MPRISVKSAQQAVAGPLPDGYVGGGRAAAYFRGDRQPLLLFAIDLKAGERMGIADRAIDRLAYIWRGCVIAGGRRLAAGSSLIVEHGGAVEIAAEEDSIVLAFSAAHPPPDPLSGGNVHLLPAEHAPRAERLAGSSAAGGVMHADADCPTCSLWLHENRFAGREATPEDAEAGIHAHTEDEIIFVLDGEMRLGTRLYGAGTALAIAAGTLYSFTPGPAGLHFANFRAAKPGDICFANGGRMSETGFWREQLPRPDYLAPLA